MAEVRQITVNPPVPDSKQYGTRNDSNLKAMFGGSPIYVGEMTDGERRESYRDLVIDGTVLNGLGFNSFDRDYSEAPNVRDVETGGGGLPASPYMPNPSSPGPGSVFANDQPPFEGALPDPGVEYGSGLGSLTSPSDTSGKMNEASSEAFATIGAYMMGSSFKGSNGQT